MEKRGIIQAERRKEKAKRRKARAERRMEKKAAESLVRTTDGKEDDGKFIPIDG
jgi:hypothetical protein